VGAAGDGACDRPHDDLTQRRVTPSTDHQQVGVDAEPAQDVRGDTFDREPPDPELGVGSEQLQLQAAQHLLGRGVAAAGAGRKGDGVPGDGYRAGVGVDHPQLGVARPGLARRPGHRGVRFGRVVDADQDPPWAVSAHVEPPGLDLAVYPTQLAGPKVAPRRGRTAGGTTGPAHATVVECGVRAAGSWSWPMGAGAGVYTAPPGCWPATSTRKGRAGTSSPAGRCTPTR